MWPENSFISPAISRPFDSRAKWSGIGAGVIQCLKSRLYGSAPAEWERVWSVLPRDQHPAADVCGSTPANFGIQRRIAAVVQEQIKLISSFPGSSRNWSWATPSG